MGLEDLFTKDIQIQLKVLHAIDAPINMLSVGDICEKAGISRQTFYRHFANKEEIIPWYSSWCEKFYLDEIGRTLTWEVGYTQHMRLLCKETHVMSLGLQHGINIPYFGGHSVSLRRKEVIKQTLTEYRNVPIDETLEFCIDAYTQLETETIGFWAKKGFDKTPEKYAELMLNIVPPRLFEAMQI